MSRAVVLATVVLVGCVVAAAGRAVPAPLPRVTMITDSVGGVLFWSDDARHVLGRGLDFVLETKTCRRLVSVGCPAYGERPPSALATIQTLGLSLGPVVVVDVGYNDLADGYADGLDSVMRALIAAGVQHVVWVTLEESRDPWIAINAQIRAAPARWPQLVVADWAPVAAKHPEWFDDRVHMNGLGGIGFAQFLRPIVLGACGSPCRFASLAPEAAMLRPTVGAHTMELRWRGNEAAVGYDLEIRRGRAWWETVVSDRPVTSYRLSGTPGSRIKVRVRARDWDAVPGAWTPPESLRFRSPARAVAAERAYIPGRDSKLRPCASRRIVSPTRLVSSARLDSSPRRVVGKPLEFGVNRRVSEHDGPAYLRKKGPGAHSSRCAPRPTALVPRFDPGSACGRLSARAVLQDNRISGDLARTSIWAGRARSS